MEGMDTFSGQELYEAFHEDLDAITDRDARIYDSAGRLLVTGRLIGLRIEDEQQGAGTSGGVRYRFGSMSHELEWDRSHRIELAPK